MNTILKLEEAAMTAMGIYLLSIYNLHLSFWLWAILFFSPDIGMLGYLVNTRTGAITYNFFHHKGIAVVVYMLGLYFHHEAVQLTGLILFGHSSLDRLMGYGLKYPDSFQHTHLGTIGKEA